ncbi:A24 family peptidase [Tsuneonella sp. HG222]
MNETVSSPVLAYAPAALLAVLALLAAVSDLRHRRIANWLSLLTWVAGLAFAVLADPAPAPSHALHSLIALVICMILFRFGVIGGGDAKFYTGVAAWLPLGKAALLLLYVSLAGVVLFFAWFAARRLKGEKVRFGSKSTKDALPYGVAIGIGGLIAYMV